MNETKFPIKFSDAVEITDIKEVRELGAKGWLLVATRNHRFIVDDDKFEENTIYSLCEPVEE